MARGSCYLHTRVLFMKGLKFYFKGKASPVCRHSPSPAHRGPNLYMSLGSQFRFLVKFLAPGQSFPEHLLCARYPGRRWDVEMNQWSVSFRELNVKAAVCLHSTSVAWSPAEHLSPHSTVSSFLSSLTADFCLCKLCHEFGQK